MYCFVLFIYRHTEVALRFFCMFLFCLSLVFLPLRPSWCPQASRLTTPSPNTPKVTVCAINKTSIKTINENKKYDWLLDRIITVIMIIITTTQTAPLFCVNKGGLGSNNENHVKMPRSEADLKHFSIYSDPFWRRVNWRRWQRIFYWPFTSNYFNSVRLNQTAALGEYLLSVRR